MSDDPLRPPAGRTPAPVVSAPHDGQAAIGLFVHLLAFEGVRLGGLPLFIGLHAGVFPVWFVVTLVLMRRFGTADTARIGTWKLILAGCPPWMRWMTVGFFVYRP